MKKINRNKIHLWKKTGAILMAGVLLLSVAGCQKKKEAPETASTQEVTEKKHDLDQYVAEGVTLPDNFDTMIYPLEALTVEYYSQRLPYYEEGGDTDSFWFSMAVLSSLLSEEEYISAPVLTEEYNYYEKKDLDSFASALYAEYAKKEWSMPELGENNSYANYDEELEKYGLLNGNIGYLSIYITGCNSSGTDYILDTQLISKETDKVLAKFQITVTPKEEAQSDDLFAYSVSEFTVVEDVDSESTTESEVEGPNAENDFDEVDGEEITEDVGEETEEGSKKDTEETVDITKEEALELAQGYLGDEDATYTYKEMVTIGDYEYYDFAVSGNSTSATDVLVCVNGVDVVSGVQNEDGSWSFDQ